MRSLMRSTNRTARADPAEVRGPQVRERDSDHPRLLSHREPRLRGTEGVQRLYNVDLMALVSYDQVTYTDDNKWSLGYLTIVVSCGEVLGSNEIDMTTLVDLAVVDPADCSPRAAGRRHGHSSPEPDAGKHATEHAASERGELRRGPSDDPPFRRCPHRVRDGGPRRQGECARHCSQRDRRGRGGGSVVGVISSRWPGLVLLLGAIPRDHSSCRTC